MTELTDPRDPLREAAQQALDWFLVSAEAYHRTYGTNDEPVAELRAALAASPTPDAALDVEAAWEALIAAAAEPNISVAVYRDIFAHHRPLVAAAILAARGQQ